MPTGPGRFNSRSSWPSKPFNAIGRSSLRKMERRMCLADEYRFKVECADGSFLRRYANAPPEGNHIVLRARPLAPKLHFEIRQRLLAGLTVALALSWVVGCGSSTKI